MRPVILLLCIILLGFYDLKSQSFDSTFHSDGIFEANLIEATSYSITRIDSGKIVVGGERYGGYYNGKLFLFNQNGTVDSMTGNNNGMVECYNDRNVTVRRLAKDTLLVLGTYILSGATKAYYYTRIVKMLPDGQLVSGFGNNGVVELCGYNCWAGALGISNDGMILTSIQDHPFISRLHPDGSRDTNFGTNGGVWLSSVLYDFYIQKFHFPSNSNKIIITGTYKLTNGTSQGAVLQLLNDGTIDSTYGVNGFVMTGNGYPACSYLQKDNSLIIGGGNGNSIAIKLKPNGELDSTFGINGHYNNNYTGYTVDRFIDVCKDSAGNLFFLGTSKDTSNGITEAHISKFSNNGKIDSSFGQNGYFSVSTGKYYWNTILSFDYEKLLISGDVVTGNNRYLSLMQINYKSIPFVEHLVPATYCNGDTATLYCHSIASSVSWFRNNLQLSDTTKWLSTTVSGSYYAVSSYEGRTDTSNIVGVLFNPIPQPVAYLQSNYLSTDSFTYYQWKDSAGNTIPGETARNFYPSANGYYSVEVVDSNGCKNSSPSIYFSSPASVKNTVSPLFYIYPNPVKDILFWKTEHPDSAQNVFIMDMQGRVLIETSAQAGQIDLKNLSAGLYIFKYKNAVSLFSKID